MNVDVGIVGGGVAGSALAHVLSRAGVSVALVEREPVFRDRIRGEAIHPWGTRFLDRLGLRSLVVDRAGARELPIWQTYRNRTRQDPFAWTDLHPSIPPELSVRHPQLQTALIESAAESGTHIFRPANVELARTSSGTTMTIRQAGETTTVTARLIVAADGAHSATRTWLGGEVHRDPIHHYLGGTIVTGLDIALDAAHHASGGSSGGFSMIFPQTEGSFRVYFACLPEERDTFKGVEQPESMMSAIARFFPDGFLSGWSELGPTGFFPNADLVSSIQSGPDTVLIGDAAGANDPSLGHGLSLCFHDVHELSTLLLNETNWSEIPAEFGERRARYFNILRQHAIWTAAITTESGPAADALRARVARARELDPGAGGFTGLFAIGPDNLVADDAARRHFLGEDIDF